MRTREEVIEEKGYYRGYMDAMQQYADKTNIDYSKEYEIARSLIVFINWLLEEQEETKDEYN